MSNSYKRYYEDYLLKISEQYRRTQSKNNNSNRLYNAIKLIEMSNRNWLWRLVEYVVVVFELMVINFTKRITNYSIRRTQIKISMILNYYKVPFEIVGKKILLKEKYSFIFLCKILFFHKNDLKIFEYIFYECIGNVDIDKLNECNLEKFALYYSRNIEFKGSINYFKVLELLYFDVL